MPKHREAHRLNVRAARRMRSLASASAAAMQAEVSRAMPGILRAAATGGEAAGLRALRRATQAARARYEKRVTKTAATQLVRGVRGDVENFVTGELTRKVNRSKGARTAKRAFLAKAAKSKLGRAGRAWENEVSRTARSWGAADASGLFSKLKNVVGQAARKGPTVSRSDMRKLVTKGRDRVTAQAQISGRRAANTAVDRVGTLRSVATRAKARAGGVESYRWTTQGDDRVREEHEARNGKKFKFSSPPPDGHPGEPPNCRCVADLAVDDVIASE